MDKQSEKNINKEAPNKNQTFRGRHFPGDRLATIVTVLQSPIAGIYLCTSRA